MSVAEPEAVGEHPPDLPQHYALRASLTVDHSERVQEDYDVLGDDGNQEMTVVGKFNHGSHTAINTQILQLLEVLHQVRRVTLRIEIGSKPSDTVARAHHAEHLFYLCMTLALAPLETLRIIFEDTPLPRQHWSASLVSPGSYRLLSCGLTCLKADDVRLEGAVGQVFDHKQQRKLHQAIRSPEHKKRISVRSFWREILEDKSTASRHAEYQYVVDRVVSCAPNIHTPPVAVTTDLQEQQSMQQQPSCAATLLAYINRLAETTSDLSTNELIE
ncbi:hypothetical protein OHC33_011232 [Knufia fluminis]|uniref:Uncharacterized protein n=1 Tax=Knufia fluminis TaxID=191047 RepID=A0AAN8E7E6_9EURO|nr:hypothetical protein OHC33_011232 [Knufia fluminis]